MSWFILIVILFTILYLVIEFLKKKNKRLLAQKYSFIQTIFVLITLAIAVYSIDSANSGTDKTISELKNLVNSTGDLKNTFDLVNKKISLIPASFQQFSNSIDTLNTLTKNQKDEIGKRINILSRSSDLLNSSLLEYKNALDQYSNKLRSIIAVTDSQLFVLRKEQEIIKKEYNRKPKLWIQPQSYITKDSIITITGILIHNDGNIESDLYSITFELPKYLFVKLESPSSSLLESNNETVIYQINFISQKLSPNTSTIYNEIKINYKNKLDINYYPFIKYSIRQGSKYTDEIFSGNFNFIKYFNYDEYYKYLFEHMNKSNDVKK